SVIYMPESDETEYTFPFEKNTFRIHYTAPFFEHLDMIEFSYQVENYQDNWSAWSDISYKEFTNLPQGEYRFCLKARNLYGVESNVADFKFTVLPPWYKSTMARITYILLFFAGIYLILKLLQQQIEKTKRRVILNHKAELKLKEEKYQLQKLLTEK